MGKNIFSILFRMLEQLKKKKKKESHAIICQAINLWTKMKQK